MKKLFLLLIVFISLFISACNIKENPHISIISQNLSNGDYDILVGITKTIQNGNLNIKPKIISGSEWINPDILTKFVFLSGKKVSLVTENFIKEKFYNNKFDGERVYFYDEVNGRRAALIVFILRNYFGKTNVGLRINPPKDKFVECNDCKVDNLTVIYKESNNKGYLGESKFRVVLDPYKINFGENDLLLYVSDGGIMKDDNFYKQNKNKINIRNFYWSYLIDMQNGAIKSFDEISKYLKKQNINFDKYKIIYLYYPNYRRRAGLPALIFDNFKF